jgi:hypothetical protein
LAFVQEVNSKVVLNSGTRFDPVFTGVAEGPAVRTVNWSPNPVFDYAWALLPGERIRSVEVLSIGGQRQAVPYTVAEDTVRLWVENLPAGLYVALIATESGLYGGRFVRR